MRSYYKKQQWMRLRVELDRRKSETKLLVEVQAHFKGK